MCSLDSLHPTVVVVEDDAGMRKALERLLRAARLQTVFFSSAEALLATEEAFGAGCLVFDIHLPGISGFELRRRLVASGCASPVIFITAQDDEVSREEARQLKCIAYLRKPFEGAALLDAIQRAFSGEQI